MKILFSPCHYIFDGEKYGSEICWAYNIANRVSNIHPSSVVVTGKKLMIKKSAYKIIEIQPNKKKLDMSLINSIMFNFQYSIETLKQICSNKYDLLHHILPFGLGNTFNLVFFLKGRLKIPLIVGPIQSQLTYDGWNAVDAVNQVGEVRIKKLQIQSAILNIFKSLLNSLSNSTLKKADLIVAINEYTGRIIHSMGIAQNKILIIPPGIDTLRFPYTPYRIKDKRTFELLTVSQLVRRKAIDVIIESLVEVVRKHDNVVLRIVGDGPQKDDLVRLVKKLCLEKHVVFEGFTPNSSVYRYYKKAHVYVSMSRSESWGQIYLEAMASGLPIITSLNDGSNEIVKNKHTGLLVNIDDKIELAQKIIFFIEHNDLIELYGKRAKEEVDKKYDWNKVIIPKYLDLYDKYIKRQK